VSIPDIGGVIGVAMMLVAYAGGQLGKLEMTALPALLMNLAGAALVLWSLAFKFNLSAALMESTWFLVALYGLIKLARRKKP
jgi:hypothetical protein